MSTPGTPRGDTFRYVGFDVDGSGNLSCDYALDGELFTERFECGSTGGRFDSDAARAAARLVWLLAGVSYYKARAPRRIVVEGGATRLELDFLRDYYVNGLAEFAHVTGVDISDVVVEPGGGAVASREPAVADVEAHHPLIPFGGGIDSIVVVEEARRLHPDLALFVANTSETGFEPIERTAAVSGLPVLRVRRHLDPKILESTKRGYLNGHVPVTGVLSAVAVLMAVAHRRDSVVMSNEHSASEPTSLVANGVLVNHQWSKSLEFETRFRELVAAAVTGVAYYSALRPYSELWVSRRFAELREYHPYFRSCNRAFYVDPTLRAAAWCGECDKCCFIDLILAPYLSRPELEAIFAGREPLSRADLADRFRDLLGEVGRSKPLECVGDEGECRRAVLLAVQRDDRSETALLHELAAYVEGMGLDTPSEPELLGQRGPHFLPSEVA